MSELAAAASDKGGDTIKQLRSAIEQARDWIAEHPDLRPVSAGRMVAILTNALAAAPQPPTDEKSSVVEQPQSVTDCHQSQPQGEQEPLFWYRPRSDGMYEGPLHKSQIERVRKESGGWVPLYTHPQPPRQPLTNSQINRLVADGEIPLSGNPYEVTRAVERAHGIGGEV